MFYNLVLNKNASSVVSVTTGSGVFMPFLRALSPTKAVVLYRSGVANQVGLIEVRGNQLTYTQGILDSSTFNTNSLMTGLAANDEISAFMSFKTAGGGLGVALLTAGYPFGVATQTAGVGAAGASVRLLAQPVTCSFTCVPGYPVRIGGRAIGIAISSTEYIPVTDALN